MHVILQDRFRQRLQEELDVRGWTQTRFAKEAGVPQTMVSKYLRGAHAPGVDVVEKFASALGLADPMDLLAPSKKPQPVA